jgi:hypothetical protein
LLVSHALPLSAWTRNFNGLLNIFGDNPEVIATDFQMGNAIRSGSSCQATNLLAPICGRHDLSKFPPCDGVAIASNVRCPLIATDLGAAKRTTRSAKCSHWSDQGLASAYLMAALACS